MTIPCLVVGLPQAVPAPVHHGHPGVHDLLSGTQGAFTVSSAVQSSMNFLVRCCDLDRPRDLCALSLPADAPARDGVEAPTVQARGEGLGGTWG